MRYSIKKHVSQKKPLSQEAIREIENKIVIAFDIKKNESGFFRTLENQLMVREQEIREERSHNQLDYYLFGFLSTFLIILVILLLLRRLCM